MHKLLLSLILFFSATVLNATSLQYAGSHTPYQVPSQITEYPDSLKPFYISHIGRHGSRYPSSPSTIKYIKFNLEFADKAQTITPTGKKLLEIVNEVKRSCNDNWGDLDSIGIAEQRGIAERMYAQYPELLENGQIEAVATSSPRAIMSMYTFAHRLSQLSSKISVSTAEGEAYSRTLRPYDENEAYLAFRDSAQWKEIYNNFFTNNCPTTVARRIVGDKFEASDDALRELSYSVYSFFSGLPAMGIDIDHTPFITDEEYASMWAISNLRHYLLYSATTVSTIPAELSIPLIEEIVAAADRVVEGRRPVAANLRFAHAETLMPLLATLQINGCYYLTHYFDQVQLNWQDYNIIPMAANLQFIFFKTTNGNIYVRTDLNERPTTLIPGNTDSYLPWEKVRSYLLNFILAIE